MGRRREGPVDLEAPANIKRCEMSVSYNAIKKSKELSEFFELEKANEALLPKINESKKGKDVH